MANVDYYYHVDATHGSFNAMKVDAAIEHERSAPGCTLSVLMSVDESEALVKVRTFDGSFAPDWANAPFIIRRLTKDDIQEMYLAMQTSFWQPPPCKRDAEGFCLDEQNRRINCETKELILHDPRGQTNGDS